MQKARSYIYTTALPPAGRGRHAAPRCALAQREGWRRERVHGAQRALPRAGAAAGVPLSASATPIQPVMLGSAARRSRAQRAAARRRVSGSWRSARRPCRRAARGCASRCRPRTREARRRRAGRRRWRRACGTRARRAPHERAALRRSHGSARPRPGAAARLGPEPRVWDELTRALARQLPRHRPRSARTRRAAAGIRGRRRRRRRPGACTRRSRRSPTRYACSAGRWAGSSRSISPPPCRRAIERLVLVATTPHSSPRRAGAHGSRPRPLMSWRCGCARIRRGALAQFLRAAGARLSARAPPRACWQKLAQRSRMHGSAHPEALARGLQRLRDGDLRAQLPRCGCRRW